MASGRLPGHLEDRASLCSESRFRRERLGNLAVSRGRRKPARAGRR